MPVNRISPGADHEKQVVLIELEDMMFLRCRHQTQWREANMSQSNYPRMSIRPVHNRR